MAMQNATGEGWMVGEDRFGISTPIGLLHWSWRQQVSSTLVGSPNLLLIGPGALAEEFLVPLMPCLASPVLYLDATRPSLPTTSVGTVIVRDVSQLARPHQRQFIEWLNAQNGTTRVITVSPRSLFQGVQRGAFLEELYYRLNTVLIELNPRMSGRAPDAHTMTSLSKMPAHTMAEVAASNSSD
jgi:hypothetical protein